jgi:DNA invertase Pin-like site-specific DNA recombinase
MPTAYSYARISTPDQKKGHGLTRQTTSNTKTLAISHGFEFDENLIIDDGRSGYHGNHVKGKGALGIFLSLIPHQVKPGDRLYVEHLDRLSRQKPTLAQAQFLMIINHGVEIYTTMDSQLYTQETVNANAGLLFLSLGMMLSNHAELAKKAGRIRDQWKDVRRGTPSGLTPSWITPDGQSDPDKLIIVRRLCCDLLLKMGFDKAAHVLNSEGVPTLSSHPRSRLNAVWDGALVGAIAKSQRILGHQPIGKYVEGKRQKTGQFVRDAYPAAITEDEWHELQAAIAARKNGTAVLDGRKTGQMTNLFGDLARCSECGNRMTVYRRGRINHFYFACSVGSKLKESVCTHRNYHRLDKIEARILEFFASRALHGWTPVPPTDPSEALVAQITALRKEATKLEAAYRRAMLREGDLALKTQIELESEHAATIKDIERLERELAGIKSAKPEEEIFLTVTGLASRLGGLKGPDLIAARAQIASALPALLPGGIRFKPDGTFIAYPRGLSITFGNQAKGNDDALIPYFIEMINALADAHD